MIFLTCTILQSLPLHFAEGTLPHLHRHFRRHRRCCLLVHLGLRHPSLSSSLRYTSSSHWYSFFTLSGGGTFNQHRKYLTKIHTSHDLKTICAPPLPRGIRRH